MTKKKKNKFLKRTDEQMAKDIDKDKNPSNQRVNTLTKGDTPFYKMRNGKNIIRILPALEDDGRNAVYGLKAWVAWLGIGNSRTPYLSPTLFGKGDRDPVAEEYFAAKENDDEANMKKFRSSVRYFVYVLDLQDEDNPDQVKIMDMPKSLYEDIIDLSQGEDDGKMLALDDPDEGYSIKFVRKEGKDGNPFPTYKKVQLIKEYPVEEELADQIIPFDELMAVPSVEKMDEVVANLLDGKSNDDDDDDDDEDEDEDERPARKSKSKDDDGKSNDDDDDDDDDDDFDERLKKAKSKSKKSKKEDDDDNDDD